MIKEDDYMDQLFKDRFENFAPSPSEEVWDGIAANTTMVNGKKLGRGAYWRAGLWLGLTLLVSFGVLQGHQWFEAEDATEIANATPQQMETSDNVERTSKVLAFVRLENGPEKEHARIESSSSISHRVLNNTVNGIRNKTLTEESVEQTISFSTSSAGNESETSSPVQTIVDNKKIKTVSGNTGDTLREENSITYVFNDWLDVDHLNFDRRGKDWNSFNEPLSVKARRDLYREAWNKQDYEKKRGGHWFVSGSFVADPRLSAQDKFIAGFDGLAFGAGKYLTPNSFVEISLRGAWSHGFNMRATYAHLFLPGRLRPYIQGGLTWGENIQLRAGLGILYEPEKVSKWRFFMVANYEGRFTTQEIGTENAGVFEIGAQLRLSGTERVISDNNWMNSVPHYVLPTNWYADASVNFSFDAKTKVIHYSAYMGRYVKKRIFVRGGIRADRENIGVPVQLQYHFLLRQKLRFGAYTGASVELRPGRLGAELGFIAYYDILPKWSLYVAPVILETSNYTERLFEMGVQLNLSKK